MRTLCLFLAVALSSGSLYGQSIVTKKDRPGSRNIRIHHYDDSFLFVSRHFGDQRDFHGNTEPGFFVHSKAHDGWLQLLQVSTKDASLGTSESKDPDERRELAMSSVTWNYTRFADEPRIDLPLHTSGSIVVPDEIVLDSKTGRYKLSFFTSWEIESAMTVLYVSQRDLIEQFDRLHPPQIFAQLPDDTQGR